MKVTTTYTPSVEALDYPKLMICGDRLIVLMISKGVGHMLQGSYELGYSANDWDMDCFEDYTGTVTLENSYDH